LTLSSFEIGWLNISPSRILTLSTRTLLELATYLKEEFGDFEVEEGEAEVPLIERIYVDCETCSTGVITVRYSSSSLVEDRIW
jgi:hypothetical protein